VMQHPLIVFGFPFLDNHQLKNRKHVHSQLKTKIYLHLTPFRLWPVRILPIYLRTSSTSTYRCREPVLPAETEICCHRRHTVENCIITEFEHKLDFFGSSLKVVSGVDNPLNRLCHKPKERVLHCLNSHTVTNTTTKPNENQRKLSTENT
jgi:hypothetical protein